MGIYSWDGVILERGSEAGIKTFFAVIDARGGAEPGDRVDDALASGPRAANAARRRAFCMS